MERLDVSMNMNQQEISARAESAEGKDLLDSDIPSIISAYEAKNPPPKEIPEKQWMLCVVGLVGAGKTTIMKPISEHLHLARICNDDIRIILRDRGFNMLRTIDIARALTYKYAAEKRALALDGDSIAPEHRTEIVRQAAVQGAPLVFIHVNPPEAFILDKLLNKVRYEASGLIEDADHAIAEYHRRKPLHEKYLSEIQFDFTLDTSRPDLLEQIKKFESLMKERGF